MATNRYTPNQLREAVAKSESWSGVCRLLGISARGGSQSYTKKKALELGCDASHFLGQSYNIGNRSGKRELSDYLVENCNTISSHDLKLKLIAAGYKEAKCEICNLVEWQGFPIVLELDHINSNHLDNRLNNLQILCPNCHSLETRRRAYLRSKKPGILLDKELNKKAKLANWLKHQEVKINKLLESGIDFGSRGWVTKAAIIIEIPVQKVNHWMLKAMPDFYASKCFKVSHIR